MKFEQKIGHLEECILSCLLQKPELMDELILEDKYFTKFKKLFIFMRAFYNKFKTFDISLMYSTCQSKYQFIQYITYLLEIEPSMSLFMEYQKELIQAFEEEKKERWKINKIFNLANTLYCKGINTEEFKREVEDIYKSADNIFKEEK